MEQLAKSPWKFLEVIIQVFINIKKKMKAEKLHNAQANVSFSYTSTKHSHARHELANDFQVFSSTFINLNENFEWKSKIIEKMFPQACPSINNNFHFKFWQTFLATSSTTTRQSPTNISDNLSTNFGQSSNNKIFPELSTKFTKNSQ